MYYKGASMLHTIRQVINNDETFRNILIGLNKTFYHQTVTAKDIETYINHHSGLNFSKVFDQYLRTIKIPVLEYKFEAGTVKYRWSNCVKGFAMPVKVKMGPEKWLYPTEEWKSEKMPMDVGFVVDRNFYVESRKVQ
jgi:aminopeptidase N